MPSGAKKRKAAKKKKGNRSNNHTGTSSASTHGHEDMKHQDHKETDVGEVSSPGSEDHHNHHDFSTEGEGKEEIEKERNFPSLPSVEGSSTEIVAKNLGSEKEIKIEDGRFKHDEAVRKSYYGGASGSSSSSSSDNESRDIEDNQAQSDSLSGLSINTNHVPVEEADDSVPENIPAADSKKISVAPYVDESVIKENGDRKLGSIENKVGTSVGLVDAVLKEEPKVQSVEKTEIVLGSKECRTQQNDDRWASPQNAHSAAIENENNSGVTEPLLVPNPVKKTSWKSCCGLFEMFTGSSS